MTTTSACVLLRSSFETRTNEKVKINFHFLSFQAIKNRKAINQRFAQSLWPKKAQTSRFSNARSHLQELRLRTILVQKSWYAAGAAHSKTDFEVKIKESAECRRPRVAAGPLKHWWPTRESPSMAQKKTTVVGKSMPIDSRVQAHVAQPPPRLVWSRVSQAD